MKTLIRKLAAQDRRLTVGCQAVLPWRAATWLLSGLDPEDPEIAFSLCDLGMGFIVYASSITRTHRNRRGYSGGSHARNPLHRKLRRPQRRANRRLARTSLYGARRRVGVALYFVPSLLLGPGIGQPLREPGDGGVSHRAAVGDCCNDPRGKEGERSQNADVALAETAATIRLVGGDWLSVEGAT